GEDGCPGRMGQRPEHLRVGHLDVLPERHVSKDMLHICTVSTAASRPGRRKAAARIRAMRVRRVATVLGSVVAASSAAVLSMVHPAIAQQIEIPPKTSITPSSHATQWVVQMAIGAIALGVLVLIGVGLGYLRFAPKFFGRDESARRPAPGARPPQLARQAAAVR